jgi:hypothetical protein
VGLNGAARGPRSLFETAVVLQPDQLFDGRVVAARAFDAADERGVDAVVFEPDELFDGELRVAEFLQLPDE